MNINNSNREAVISELNECFNDHSQAVCYDQGISIECFIRGYAKASLAFNALAQNEFDEIIKCLDAPKAPISKPSFFDTQVKQLSRSEIKATVKAAIQQNGRSIDSALDCLNQLISQDVEFPCALSLVLDDYLVDQEELTNAYDAQ